jgi:flagellar hook-associated protein 2
MSTTATTASPYFTGESTFSAALNNVITQSVARATLPITALQTQQSALTDQQTEVQLLGTDFEAVQTAIDGLNTAAGSGSYSASVDVPAVATAAVSTGSLPGTYALDVTSIGSESNTISAAGTVAVTDPSSQNISAATSFTLTVAGTQHTLSPASTSLNSLVTAINSSGAGVQATVVNVGGSAAPDYRLSVQSTSYGPDTIQLNDGTKNLLTSLNTGAYVTYQINGQPAVPINSTSRSLSLSTGLTADVLTTGSANITVSANSSGVSTAIAGFVTAYNAASAELTKNRGQNGGALAGNGLILELQNTLNAVGSYSAATTGVNSLADIGLTFNDTGQLVFDQTTFDAVAPAAVTSFLGAEAGTAAGSGFLAFADTAMESLTNSTSGTITESGTTIGASIISLTAEIATKQAQVTALQTNLTDQMATADAAITSLQGQLSEITDLFSAETQNQKNITG